MKDDIFIFSIAYNCGMIMNKCLESFHKYHDKKIHIFGTHKDFKQINKHINNEYIELSADDMLKEYYKNGHLGTAYIWAGVLSGKYTNCQKVLQIDSDTLFREECVSDIYNGFSKGFDLIGPRRSYEKNTCNRNDLTGLKDVVSTYFVGVNKEKISTYDFNILIQMSAGYFNPLNHPILDFFDPISFDILKNGGKIYYLDIENYGSTDENGTKINSSGELNTIMDFGKKLIHFAGIGSGMNFYYNGSGTVPVSYSGWAKERFSMYMKLFYNEDIKVEYNKEIYEKVKKSL